MHNFKVIAVHFYVKHINVYHGESLFTPFIMCVNAIATVYMYSYIYCNASQTAYYYTTGLKMLDKTNYNILNVSSFGPFFYMTLGI